MTLVDNIREYFSSDTAQNKNVSILSGLLFFSGWWVLIDALAVDQAHQINTGQVFIGVFGTISFLMVNLVTNSHLSEDNLSQSGVRIAKLWLLIGFVLGFASIFAAVWVMIDFTNNPKKDTWPGVSILIQNSLILIANLAYKFGRNEDNWDN